MISIYTLTSELHDEKAVDATTRQYLQGLGLEYRFCGGDFTDYGTDSLSLIYVRTGGTEGIFLRLLPTLLKQTPTSPFYLLASDTANSLAASMEILSYLRSQGLEGEILHGTDVCVACRAKQLAQAGEARQALKGMRLGIIGQPSDWLISSTADPDMVRNILGIELVDIPIKEVTETTKKLPLHESCEHTEREEIRRALPRAEQIYHTLHKILEDYCLQGFTLRCFDLLSSLQNTGCLALARLNAEGYVATCEGDVPAMLSMAVARAACGTSGFQANPARIDTETGEILFAHCTIPLNMVERYELDTHFESGIGVGIRGYMQPGPVTIFKLSGDLQRSFMAEGEILCSQAAPNLCRTQLLIRLAQREDASYFLTNPIGNHHIILPGLCADLLREVLKMTP